EFGDAGQRFHGGAIGGVVQHEDQWDALALVAFRLDDGGNADIGFAEDGGDAGQHAGFVHDVEPDKVLRNDFADRCDRAGTFMRYKRRQPVFGAELQGERGGLYIVDVVAGGGIL